MGLPPPREGGEALIHLDRGKSYRLTKIYHGFRQWCALLEPGMKVAGTTVRGPCASGTAQPGVKASAFVRPDGKRLIVQVAAVQDKAAEVELRVAPPFPYGRYRWWRTSPEEDCAEQPAGVLRNGRLTTRLPARTMLTVCLQPATAR